MAKDIPTRLTGTLLFGKHYGKTLAEAIKEDPAYIVWATDKGLLLPDMEAVNRLRIVWKDRFDKELEINYENLKNRL